MWVQTLAEGQSLKSDVQSRESEAQIGAESGTITRKASGSASPEGLLAFPQLAGTKRVAQRISPQAGDGESARFWSSSSGGCTPTSRRRWPWRSGCSSCTSDPPRTGASQASMNSKPQPAGPQDEGHCCRPSSPACSGRSLGLCLLKFGNPPITEKWITRRRPLGLPVGVSVANRLGVLAAGPVGVAGIAVARWKPVGPWWLVALPAAWLAWEFIAGTQSVDAQLTSVTLKHFTACVVCFYLGYFSLSRVQRMLAVLAGAGVRVRAGPCCRLGATVRRPEGVAPLLLSLRLSHTEGSPAGLSQEDFQRPHLLQHSFIQTPWPGCCCSCCPPPWPRCGNCAAC